MAPHERVIVLGLLLFAACCSGREVQGHSKYATSSSNQDLEPDEKKDAKLGGNHLYVSKTGNANFNRIQAAIDSIPENNEQWVHIDIAAGLYQ